MPILIEDPLQNIDAIYIDTADYSLSEFNSAFRNKIRLWLCDNSRDYMFQKLPHLEELIVLVDKKSEKTQIKYDDVVKAMRTNPHIKRLKIDLIGDFYDNVILQIIINGPEVGIFIDHRKNWDEFTPSRLEEIVQPQNFEKMNLYHTHLTYHH